MEITIDGKNCEVYEAYKNFKINYTKYEVVPVNRECCLCYGNFIYPKYAVIFTKANGKKSWHPIEERSGELFIHNASQPINRIKAEDINKWFRANKRCVGVMAHCFVGWLKREFCEHNIPISQEAEKRIDELKFDYK